MSSNPGNPPFRVAWCSYDAAKFAVERWHYSRRMPAGKLVKVGVWEDGAFIGCVLFGRGATRTIGSPYGLDQTECCELVRVALDIHVTPTSKIIGLALKFLARNSPGIKLVISYADTKQGHIGTIYQATNWIYVGDAVPSAVRLHGRIRHRRSLVSKYGTSAIPWLREHIDPRAEVVHEMPKHKYLMPLTPDLRVRCEELRLPYPKRAGSIDSDALASQVREGGDESDPGAPTAAQAVA